MNRTHETFWWSLFSAGGVVAAFVVPVLIFLTGMAGPVGWGSEEPFSYVHMKAVLSNVAVKLFLFAALSLPMFHCAHRIRHVLCDIGMGVVNTRASWAFYLPAIVGTAVCAVLLWQI